MIKIRKIRKLIVVIMLSVLFVSYIDKDIYYASEIEIENIEDSEQESIAVTNIEIGNYDKEIEVGKTTTLSTTVVPSNTTNSTVTYKSSDSSIATVSSSGEVKGVSKGNATITIGAGEIVKSISIKVKVATKEIELKSKFIVLKSNEEYQISASVSPSEANQSITYKSLEPSVATVSETGNVKAKAEGSTSIIVSNGDISTAVTVMVNKNSNTNAVIAANQTSVEPTIFFNEKEKELMSKLDESDVIHIKSTDIDTLTKNILKKLQENNAKLIVSGEGYTITILGKDIINFENELSPHIEFTKENDGYTFTLNVGNNLPGMINLKISDDFNGKYLYLYNQSKDKYEVLSNNQDKKILDQAGKYYISDQKLSKFGINLIIVMIVIIVLLGLVIGYIIVKKKYWFW